MCSQNADQVEVVRRELLKAGISAETHAIAGSRGAGAVELWVPNERDFFEASKLYARLQNWGADTSQLLAINAKSPARSISKPNAETSSPPANNDSLLEPAPEAEPRRAELKQASSLLEKGLEEMFSRERELVGKCAALRSQVEDLTQKLTYRQTALVHEIDRRKAAEATQANQVEQIAGLESVLGRERCHWQQQLKSREDLLKTTEEKLNSVSSLLETHQQAVAALQTELGSVQRQRDEQEKSLSTTRAEALAERAARIAADERSQKACQALGLLEKKLAKYEQLEQQMQAHLASLSSLFGGRAPAAKDPTVA